MLVNKRLFSLIFTVFMSFVSAQAFADANTYSVSTPVFSMNVPQNLEKTAQVENQKINLYQYAYTSSRNSNSAHEQLRISVIADAPANKKHIAAWEVKTLDAMITYVTQNYNLTLTNDQNLAQQSPVPMTIGNQTFSTISMDFSNHMQAKFLVAIVNKLTYMITLISKNDDAQQRAANMSTLMNAVNSLQYISLPTTAPTNQS